jgi:hypothetical protein
MAEHVCVDCAALPEAEQPSRPRPAPHGGPRSRRCVTHYRAFRASQRSRVHENRVTRIYGLRPGEYERLLQLQGGTCAMPRCKANGKRKRLAVDHDHETGEVRGLLCGPHNYELVGRYAGDLHDAIAYLQDPPARRLASTTPEGKTA